MKTARRWHRIALPLALLISMPAHASDWSELWHKLWWRDDQQGQQQLQQQRASEAAKRFDDPQWQAYAHYRAGEYQAAVNALKANESARAHYNRGNALAQLGEYQQAIGAYEQALALEPNHEDAEYNKALIEKLLKENPPQQQQSDQQQDSQQQEANKDQESEQPDKQDGAPEPKPEQDKAQENEDADKNKQPQNQTDPNEGDDKDKDKDNDKDKGDNEGKDNIDEIPQELHPEEAEQQASSGFSKQEQSHPDSSPENIMDAVEDDPGGLLKQKFLRDYLRRQQGGK